MHLSRRALFLTAGAAGLSAPGFALAQGARALTVSQFSETRDLASIDPMRSLDFTIPTSLIFDTLLERDAAGHLVPSLATAWARIAPTVWRFTLRGDARFHDGSPLTAADAAATVNFAMEPANRSGLRLQIQPVARAEAPDATTLLLHTSLPTGLLPQIVGALPVMQAAQLAAADAPFRNRPVGSGPWRLAGWQPGERVEMEATGTHWRQPQPAFARITVRAVPEASTRVADLLSGGAQIAADIPPGLAGRIARGGARVVAQPGARTQYLSFWFRPPFDDARVRRAVYHAIDRQALADAVWGDLAEVATGAVARGAGGYVAAYPFADHDPDRARALLREAGIAAPLAVDLDTPPAEMQAAQVLQSQMARAGFTVRINPLDSIGAVFDTRRLAGQAAGRIFIATALDNHVHDAVRPYTAFYAQAGFLKAALGYSPDARLAGLLAAYMAEENEAARDVASAALMAVAREDAAAIYLAYPKAVYGVANAVEMPPNTHGRLDFPTLRPRAA
ncbi:ABC transporter substrate-binding protein [Humitalea sp. 24SJ18S-53]|uniref:ABC transporter substrate-binding protein n=1 Tax=Humitalea sp. 24SJ18S-53 TaxID=3422307 RepID=UPI003D6737A3